jgi:hypothetical protein
VEREERVERLVDDFQNGYLTRRGFFAKAAAFGLTAAAAMGLLGVPRMQRTAIAQDSVQPKQWEQGKGWGWVWGDDDQLGNLNELSPELTLKALSRVEEGKVYDLGLMYDRNSYRFEGHNPGEIISFRTPDGLNTQEDIDFVTARRTTRSTRRGPATRCSSVTTSPPRSTRLATSTRGARPKPTTASAQRRSRATSAS